MKVVWVFLWCNMNIRCHRSSFWPLCVNGSCLHLKITAHQMVRASPRQPSCGGEAGVGFRAQTQLDRNGIISSNKKLSDSSTSRNKHWVTPGGGPSIRFPGRNCHVWALLRGDATQEHSYLIQAPPASSTELLPPSQTQRDFVPTLTSNRFIHSFYFHV